MGVARLATKAFFLLKLGKKKLAIHLDYGWVICPSMWNHKQEGCALQALSDTPPAQYAIYTGNIWNSQFCLGLTKN